MANTVDKTSIKGGDLRLFPLSWHWYVGTCWWNYAQYQVHTNFSYHLVPEIERLVTSENTSLCKISLHNMHPRKWRNCHLTTKFCLHVCNSTDLNSLADIEAICVDSLNKVDCNTNEKMLCTKMFSWSKNCINLYKTCELNA